GILGRIGGAHVVLQAGRRIVLRAFPNPTGDQLDLLGRQRIGVLGHRRLVAGNVIQNQALVRLAGGKRLAVLAAFAEVFVRREQQFAAPLRRLMATGTIPLQDRPDLPIKTHRLVFLLGGRRLLASRGVWSAQQAEENST